jgi:hypothetical protein
MEINAVKLEKLNPTQMSFGDYLIVAGLVCLCIACS